MVINTNQYILEGHKTEHKNTIKVRSKNMNVGNLRANSAGHWKNDGANTIGYLCEGKKKKLDFILRHYSKGTGR